MSGPLLDTNGDSLEGSGPAITKPLDVPKPRDSTSWKTLYQGLQTRVDTARLLLANVKVEKGSSDTMNAVLGLLKGNS